MLNYQKDESVKYHNFFLQIDFKGMLFKKNPELDKNKIKLISQKTGEKTRRHNSYFDHL